VYPPVASRQISDVVSVIVTDETVSDVVAARVREARKARGWLTGDLAARCAELGCPELTENVIENIESGRRDRTGRRRREVTVDELRVLSDALHFSPADVLGGLPPGSLGPMTADEMETLGEALRSAASLLKWQAEQAGHEDRP
jgi:hypothetical protein